MAAIDGLRGSLGECRRVNGNNGLRGSLGECRRVNGSAFVMGCNRANSANRPRVRHKDSAKTGQFFLLGAFLVSTLFFMGLPRPAAVNVDSMEDMGFVALNLQKEMPNAFNLGLRQGDFLGVMRNFTWFAENVLKSRRLSFGAMLCFGSNISTTDFNVTVLNYYSGNQTVNITIGSTMKQLFVQYNQSNSTTFSSTGTLFNISFMYAGEEKNMTWARDKYSIYGMLNLTRAGSATVKDFQG